MDWENFTPLPALLGGLLIGTATSLMLAASGRIAGISGIVGQLLVPRVGDVAWRGVFIAGLLAGGILLRVLAPASFPEVATRPLGWVVVAGLVVGFGTRLGSGCTSGHGVCGHSRLSPRSAVSTVTFIVTGALTVLLWRAVTGGTA